MYFKKIFSLTPPLFQFLVVLTGENWIYLFWHLSIWTCLTLMAGLRSAVLPLLSTRSFFPCVNIYCPVSKCCFIFFGNDRDRVPQTCQFKIYYPAPDLTQLLLKPFQVQTTELNICLVVVFSMLFGRQNKFPTFTFFFLCTCSGTSSGFQLQFWRPCTEVVLRHKSFCMVAFLSTM